MRAIDNIRANINHVVPFPVVRSGKTDLATGVQVPELHLALISFEQCPPAHPPVPPYQPSLHRQRRIVCRSTATFSGQSRIMSNASHTCANFRPNSSKVSAFCNPARLAVPSLRQLARSCCCRASSSSQRAMSRSTFATMRCCSARGGERNNCIESIPGSQSGHFNSVCF